MPSTFDPEKTIRNGVRDWLRSASVPSGTAKLIKDKVIPANDEEGITPKLPYMTVLVTTVGLQVGTDEDLHSLDISDDPQIKHRGERVATVSVQGFGYEAGDWMSRAVLRLRSPAIQTIVDDAGLTIRPVGPLINVGTLLDTSIEAHYSQDFEVDYTMTTDPEAQTELLTMETDVTLTSPGQTDLDFTVIAPEPSP